jgi:hypothetical protein
MIIKLNIHAVDTISNDTRSSVLRLLKCAHVTSCHRKGRNALLQRRDCQSLPARVTLSRDGHRVWELLGRWSSNFKDHIAGSYMRYKVQTILPIPLSHLCDTVWSKLIMRPLAAPSGSIRKTSRTRANCAPHHPRKCSCLDAKDANVSKRVTKTVKIIF